MIPQHYDAARHQAAVFTHDLLGVLQLTGAERHTWLQGMVTNDVEKLKPGESCYAAHLNAQGKVVAQMTVCAMDNALLLLVEQAAAEKLAIAFDRLIIMEDVQLQNVSADYSVLGLIGPKASAVLQAAHSTHYQAVSSELGYDLLVAKADVAGVYQTVSAAGAVPITEETWNVLRIEAGLPLYGVDVDETTTMPELGQRGISYDKGCYIGQEVVARIKYIGHVNRRFVGFVCAGADVPEVRGSVQVQSKDVGYITSAVFSPSLGKAVALGFVSRTAGEPGTEVVLAGQTPVAARVATLPIVPIPSAG